MESNLLSESVRLAIAPVFLLTAVAGMLSALSQRLARVVDRARQLHRNLKQDSCVEEHGESLLELANLRRRGYCINLSMGLLVLCAILIGMTVLELFFTDAANGRIILHKYVVYTFVGGVGSFISALCVFLVEVVIASYSIRWRP